MVTLIYILLTSLLFVFVILVFFIRKAAKSEVENEALRKQNQQLKSKQQ